MIGVKIDYYENRCIKGLHEFGIKITPNETFNLVPDFQGQLKPAVKTFKRGDRRFRAVSRANPEFVSCN